RPRAAAHPTRAPALPTPARRSPAAPAAPPAPRPPARAAPPEPRVRPPAAAVESAVRAAASAAVRAAAATESAVRSPAARGGRRAGEPAQDLADQGIALGLADQAGRHRRQDRKSTRLNSSHVKTSHAVLCLKKK